MNRVYRVVWRAASQSWVVASELATGKKKSASARTKALSLTGLRANRLVMAIAGAVLLGGAIPAQSAVLDWTGATGNGDPNDPGNWAQNVAPDYADTLNINQLPKMVLDQSHLSAHEMNFGAGAGSQATLDVINEYSYINSDTSIRAGVAGGQVELNFFQTTEFEKHVNFLSDFTLGSGLNSQGTLNVLGDGKTSQNIYSSLAMYGQPYDSQMLVGHDQGRGIVNVEGGSWSYQSTPLFLGSGTGGTGQINVLAGGKVASNAIYEAYELTSHIGYAGGTGTITINPGMGLDRNKATLMGGASIGVGTNSLGLVNVLGGGKLTTGTFVDPFTAELTEAAVGVDGGIGKVVVEGSGSIWIAGGNAYLSLGSTSQIGHLYLGQSGYGAVTLSNGGELFVGAFEVNEGYDENGNYDPVQMQIRPLYDQLGKLYLATQAGSVGVINLGNDPDSAIGGASIGRVVAEKIVLGEGSAWINFNHNQDLAYSSLLPVLDSSAQGAGTLNLGSYAGTTRLDLAQPSFKGFTDIYGGTLVVADSNALGASVIRGRYHAGVPEGGTLVYGNGLTLANAMELHANAKLGLQVDGTDSAAHTGPISGDGHLRKQGSGTLTLSGDVTHTGTTFIDAGALSLAANTHLDTSAGVVANGTLDISGHSGTAAIKTLSGTGSVALGSNTLTITAGSSNGEGSGLFAGNIQGAGGLTVAGGNQRLSGSNTFNGVTQIDSGATLTLEGASHLINSAQVIANGTLAVSAHSDAASIKTLSGAGRVELAGGNTLNITAGGGNGAGSGSFAGVMNGAGGLTVSGGNQGLAGANTYLGVTRIEAGATLGLEGAGDISSSSGVIANGALDIAAHAGDALIKTLSGNGSVALGANTLNITAAGSNGAGSGTFAGVIDGAGGLTVSGGTQALAAANTYQGTTQIDAGATLVLQGTGDIANSAGVIANGALDIAPHSGPISLKTLSGSGDVTLGSNDLTITAAGSNGAASGTFAGNIAGAGGLTVAAGEQQLTGANTYQGATQINAGATLALEGAGDIGASAGVIADGALDISAYTGAASIKTLAGSGEVALGGNTLNITAGSSNGAGSGSFAGVIDGAGGLTLSGGTQVLMAANTYQGTTQIDAGATLALQGAGDIANSAGVIANGALDIAPHSGPISLKTLSGSGDVTLGSNDLTITAAGSNGEGSGLFAGDISGVAGLTIAGGNQRLSGTNSFGGVTQIDTGATLTLEGASQLSNSAQVNADGTLAVSAHPGAASIKTLSGAGRVELAGDNTLKITAGGSNGAGSGSFAGVIDGAGGLTVSGGTQALTAANSYQGTTQIDAGATLALQGAGDIASSAGVIANGALDIAPHSGPISLKTLSGSGDVTLGSNDLTITAAGSNGEGSGLFAGDISGVAGLTIAGGDQRLSGTNSFSGMTRIDSGATLTLEGTGQLTNSAEVHADGTLAVSAHAGAASIKTLSGEGRVEVAGGNTLNITAGGSNGAGSGSFAGVIDGAGGLTVSGGTEQLSGVNTYQGTTLIQSGATLDLQGNGSIAESAGVVAEGTFNLAAHTGDALIRSLAGNGSVTLGANSLIVTAGGSNGLGSGLFHGVINGTGGLTVNSGIQSLSGDNRYEGATLVRRGATLAALSHNTLSPTSIHTVEAGGNLLLNAYNQSIHTLNNAGMVVFNQPDAISTFRRTSFRPTTLTVTGDNTYNGQGGTLVLRTQLGGDNSLTDKLVVNGNTTGTTHVLVRNAGGLGAETQKGIEIVQVDGKSGGQFLLAAPVEAGAFEYELFQGDYGDPSNGNWYLSSSGEQPGLCPDGLPGPCDGEDPDPGEPNYRSEVANVVAAQSANMEQGMTMLSTLHQRIGGAYNLHDNERLGWMRLYNDNDRSEGDRFNYDQRITGLQMGHDLWVRQDAKGTTQRAGISIDYTNGDADFEDQNRAKKGKRKHTGDMDTDILSAGGYYTIASQDGAYFDSLLMISRLENDFTDIYGDKGRQKGWRVGLSAEVGKPIAQFAKTWTLEPQAQLSYQHSRYEGFDDEVSEIDSYNVDTVRGRVGMRLKNAAKVQDKPAQAYVIANLVHDFLKPTEVDFNGTDVRDKYDQTSYEVGAGGRMELTQNATLFGDARYRKSFAGDTQSTMVNVGVQVRF